MDRTNAPGHVNHLFVAEDPATNRPPTEITAQDLNAHQEELISIILAAQMAPDGANNAQVIAALNAMFAKINGATGLIRTLTPAGGARIRELGDIANAATVGGIEFGIGYNCNIDPATGVWAGRDVADICWLEKWMDAGGIKEFWYAPNAEAGAVPAWTLGGEIDLVNGTPQFDNSKKLATTEFVKRQGLSSAATVVVNATTVLTATDHAGKTLYVGGVAPITLTLPLLAAMQDGSQIQFNNTSSGLVTILRQGADNIAGLNSIAATSYALNPGDQITLAASPALGQWFVIGSSSIGVGQTWQDVTASRVVGTTYTNTTGRPISVSLSVNGTGSTLNCYINGSSLLAGVGLITTAASNRVQLFAIVPPGATYGATGNAPDIWKELR